MHPDTVTARTIMRNTDGHDEVFGVVPECQPA
jgi:hypothetical protein